MKKKKKHYKVKFTTRKNFSFIIILIFLIFASLSSFVIYINEAKYLEAVIAFLLTFVFFSFFFNNEIILEKYFIRISFGIFICKIKYKDIKGLYILDNHFPSLSSSHHKVGIKKNNLKTIIFDTFISPFDREDFIYEVKNRC